MTHQPFRAPMWGAIRRDGESEIVLLTEIAEQREHVRELVKSTRRWDRECHCRNPAVRCARLTLVESIHLARVETLLRDLAAAADEQLAADDPRRALIRQAHAALGDDD
jgi:hypothetical protein